MIQLLRRRRLGGYGSSAGAGRQPPPRRGVLLVVSGWDERPIARVAILILWAGYCVALTLAAPALDLDFGLFALFAPACAALGFLVPRHSTLLAPVALAPLLALLVRATSGFSADDPVGFLFVLWLLYFAVPGVVSVALGAGLRRQRHDGRSHRRGPPRRGQRAW
jgi:hypothetical protein